MGIAKARVTIKKKPQMIITPVKGKIYRYCRLRVWKKNGGVFIIAQYTQIEGTKNMMTIIHLLLIAILNDSQNRCKVH
jgi:hypothetical protein